jgi:hypothetical protein
MRFHGHSMPIAGMTHCPLSAAELPLAVCSIDRVGLPVHCTVNVPVFAAVQRRNDITAQGHNDGLRGA